MKTKIVTLVVLTFLFLQTFADIVVSDVDIHSEYPWQKVSIGYKITGSTDKPLGWIEITAKNNANGKSYVCKTLEGVDFTPGNHVITWNAASDGAMFKSDDVVFTIRIMPLPLYCVIDLSEGATAVSYPVTLLADIPSGGWTDEYKTKKLVLRRIEPGTFKMLNQYDVTLTQLFYIGVFEVTQKQYELVTGVKPNPSYYSNSMMRPANLVSYSMIRGDVVGACWPTNKQVDADSFLGKLRSRTDFNFDLPTEAQWEYSCRAGTTSKYNNGGNAQADFAEVGAEGTYEKIYESGSYNTYGYLPANVGTKLPNAWGIYDMHGNVKELCLDWYDAAAVVAKTNPMGPDSGSDRVIRGGGYRSDWSRCTSFDRGYVRASTGSDDMGFRLALTLKDGECQIDAEGDLEVLAEAHTGHVAVNTISSDIKVRDVAILDGRTWCYVIDGGHTVAGGQATIISGEKNTPAISVDTAGFVSIPERMGGCPVVVIGEDAFIGCTGLTSVKIPNSVKKTEGGAFRGCTALTEVEIPDSVTDLGDNVFYGCTALKHVKLPKGLAAIGIGVFRGCSSLEEIDLPASLQSIGADAYYGCSNVIELNIPDGVTSIGNTAFKDCTELRKVSIPDSVTTIGNSAFAGCANVRTVSMPTRFRMSTIFPSSNTAITTATMPEGTTKVADNAYYGCAGLSSVTLPSCVTAIGNNAFRGCAALASVAFPAGLLTIGEYAYYGCSGLSSVEIPQSVTQVGANAFGGCNGLISVTVPECVTSIKTTFPNAYQQITSVGLTRTCESIPSGMFSGCAALASITFPPDISSIGASAFSGCVGLSEVVIPASVKEIGENAFLNCTSLEAVSIPSSVEVLGATAFKGCAAIKTVVLERADKPLKVLFPDAYRTIENLTVNELTIDAADFFEGCESLVDVDVPEDCELYSWTFKEPRFDGDWWIENGWVLGYAGETGTSFVLPEELTKFGGGAFDGNAEIEEVTFGEDTEVAGGFSNCPELQIVNFGGSERRIGAYAFWGDTYLDNVTVPASVEEIGKEAFLNCSYIQDLAFEGGVRDIGAGAFSNCASLISLELKDGVKRIGENAFYGCWRLMSVKLPLSIEQIGENAFKGLKNLTGVTVPTHVKTMKEIFPDRYSSIKTVVIPEGETDIIDGMFDGCSSLISVVIPNSVTNVGARAFGGCSSLVELGLPDSVRRIGASALTGCSKIKDFTLPKNLEVVGDAAFSSCSLLTTMVIPETVTQIGAGIVPSSLRSLYFLGNAPVCVGNPLNGSYSGLTVYVIRGTKGWDGVATSRVLPEAWNGRAITSWTPNQFDVVFDANGGEPETYTVQEITDNSYAFPKAEPTMTGYDFAGWWTEREGGAEVKTYTKVTATKSHTLYAHWELRDDVVIVNFNANGGTITPMSKVYVVGYPFVDLPVPTRRGYRFAGWRSETGAAVSEKTIATAQMSTLVASWTANGYTVVYHSNDGEDAQVSQSFSYGVETTLRRNTFTRRDHAFVGWATVADGDKVYDDADAVVNLAEVDGSVVHLYAVWIRTVVNYAVRFDGNGGGGSMDNENFTEGEVKCLTSNAFVRAGFIFVGWSLVPDGEVVYEDGEEVSNLPFGTDHTLSLYAVWIAEDEFVVSKPIVNVPQDGTFDTETFLVTLSCATKGAEIYYSTNGRTPRVSEQSRYSQPFEIADTTTIIAVAVRYGKLSAYTEVTITKVDPVVLTLETSLDEPKLKGVTTGGDADWTAVREEFARVGGACAKSGSVGMDQRTWLEATVSGKGELTFYWRVSCEHDGRGLYSYDHLVFTAKDAHKEFKIDGVTDWIQQKVTFETEGEHTVRWEYVTDDWEEPGFADCGWVDGVVWTPSAAPEVGPTVEGDEGATVTGNAETGFVVKPSEGKTSVEVTIPQGVDASKVTVEVPVKVVSVKPNGAKVKIVSGGADITEFLNMPAADGNGIVDLTKATVKEEIVKEAMDVEKGAKIELDAANPTLITPNTRVGLFYQLREGETLGGMKNGDSTIGDGNPWKPEIKVKGGNSAFYSIEVGK